jgi:L-fuconolactonase
LSAGFRHLEPRGLSFDATVFHTQLDELCDLAEAFPETRIVLVHLGLAMNIGLGAQERRETFNAWRAGIGRLAQHPNVTCKVGGLGLPFWAFGFDKRADATGFMELAAAWQPYVETAIELFGADRCMMQSDFPPDGISCGFVPMWNAMKHIVRGCSPDDKARLFHRTAARVYRIDLPAA